MKTKLDEKLAYFLGYIAWGNHLTKNRNYYLISVKHENKAALIYFNNLLNLNRNILSGFNAVNLEYDSDFEEGYLRNTLAIPVKSIENILNKYYFGARNLLRFDFPPSIPHHLFGAYLRGYFEKHGSVVYSGKTKQYREVILSMPSYDFAFRLKARLEKEGIISKEKICEWKGHKTVYKLRISTKSFETFKRLMYGSQFGPILPIRSKLNEAVELHA